MAIQWDSLLKVHQAIAKSGLSSADQQKLLLLLEILSSSETNAQEGEETLDVNSFLSIFQQKVEELDTLRKLSVKLTASLNLPVVLRAVASEAMRLIKNARSVHISLYDPEKDRLEFGTAMNQNGVYNQSATVSRLTGILNAIVRKGEIVIIEDTRTHPSFQDLLSEFSGSILCIPLKIEDRIVGVMNISRSVTGQFSPSELRLLHLLADQAAVAISNARVHTLLNYQAYTDAITGLPNRRALDERLEAEIQQARRHLNNFSVIMMDLDNFKDINDTYGHDVGDQILRITFNYLAQNLRSSDFLCRFGGDELTLVLSDTDSGGAQLVAKKIADAMSNYYVQLPDGTHAKIGISGGIAVYPVHARSAANLLRAADEALYRAKKNQRGTFEVARVLTGPLPAATAYTIL